jgi:heme O synthase-like polyprenyltransferase
MVGISLSLVMAKAGLIYLIPALVLGAVFVGMAAGVWRAGDHVRDRGLFRYSIVYLMTLFVALIADSLAR